MENAKSQQQYWQVGLAAGLAGSVLWLLAVLGAPFASLPLFVAGLGWGVKAVAVAAVTGSMFSALVLGFGGVVSFAGLIGLPVLGLTHLALLARTIRKEDGSPRGVEWYPAGRILAWISAIAIALFLVPHLILASQGGFPGLLTAALPELVTSANAARVEFGLAPLAFTDAEVRLVALAIPALACGAWLLMIGINMLLAHKILKHMGRRIRGPFDVERMELPPIVAYTALVAFILALIGGRLGFEGSTILAILAVTYFIMGLITLHAVTASWVERSSSPQNFVMVRTIGLFAFYMMILLESTLAVAVCVVGIMDQWIGIRRRALAPRLSKESE